MPSTARVLDACMPNLDTWKCESTYDASQVLESLSYTCMNKTSCTVNARKYVDRSNGPEICVEDTAQFYVQVF